MNTNRWPRKRPRVHSMSFRAFYHLVAVEAAFQVLRRWWRVGNMAELSRRDYVALWPTTWRRRADYILRHHVIDGRIE